MEGLSSSALHLERERLEHPLVPTQHGLSFGLLSFPWAPAVSQHPQTFSLWCSNTGLGLLESHGCPWEGNRAELSGTAVSGPQSSVPAG